MDTVFCFSVIVWSAIGAIGASLVAQSKGLSGGLWAFAGLLLGPIAILIVGFMAPGTPSGDDYRKCPYCAESIKREARVCRFCGRDVEPMESLAARQQRVAQEARRREAEEPVDPRGVRRGAMALVAFALGILAAVGLIMYLVAVFKAYW